MPSKMVTRQRDATASIASAAIKNAETLAAKLTELIAAHAAKADAPPAMDWKSILVDIGNFLLEAGNGLVDRDNQLQLQRRLERQLRFERNEASDVIRIQLKGVRFLIDEAFGKDKSKVIFPARTAIARLDPSTLLRVAQEATELLQGSGIQWPQGDRVAHAATPAQLLANLQQHIPRLQVALEGLGPEKRGAEHALGNKTRDYEATVEAMQRGADLLYGLLRFVGFDTEADRLRPRRKKARATGQEEPPAAPMLPPASDPQLPPPGMRIIEAVLVPQSSPADS